MSIASFTFDFHGVQVSVLQDFGERVAQERREKQARERRDIAKKEVADVLGTSAATYGRWEAGLVMPDDEMMVKLAAYYGVTPAWLRYGQEPRTLPSTARVHRTTSPGEDKKRA